MMNRRDYAGIDAGIVNSKDPCGMYSTWLSSALGPNGHGAASGGGAACAHRRQKSAIVAIVAPRYI